MAINRISQVSKTLRVRRRWLLARTHDDCFMDGYLRTARMPVNIEFADISSFPCSNIVLVAGLPIILLKTATLHAI